MAARGLLVADTFEASSLPAPPMLGTARPGPAFRPSIPGSSLDPSALTRHLPDVTDRLDLTLDVSEEGRVGVPLEPLLDQGPEDDLKTHGELERHRRPPRKDPGLVHDFLGEDEEDSRLIREHYHL
jgi:hypothetical protein